MSRAPFLCSFAFIVNGAIAQNIPLTGTIAIQNSQHETGARQFVSGASIRAPFAQASSSDGKGEFQLLFMGLEPGASVRITVDKPGLVVVNSAEVEQVVLGRLDPFTVVMSDANKLAEAKTRYQRIAVDAIVRNYERDLSALRDRKRALDIELAHSGTTRTAELKELSDALDRLTHEREVAMEQADDLAERFSAVNLDDASDLYRRAYTSLQHGQLDSALLLLGQQALDRSYDAAIDQKRQGEIRVNAAAIVFHQLTASYRLKADVLQATLRFQTSLQALQALLKIVTDQADSFEPLDRISALTEVGRMEQRIGDIDRSRQDLDSALVQARTELPPDHVQFIAIQRLRSSVLLDKGELEAARTAANEAVAVARESLGPDHVELGYALADLAQVHIEDGRFEEALETYAQARDICSGSLSAGAPYMGALISAIGIAYLDLGELDSALSCCTRGVEMLEAGALAGDPRLAIALSDLAVVLSIRGETRDAIDVMRRARSIISDALGDDHPDIAKLDLNLGTELKNSGFPDSAMIYYDRARELITRTLGEGHAIVGMAYSMIGSAYMDLQDSQAALTNARKARTITINALGPDHTEVAMIDNSLGTIFFGLGVNDSALFYYDEALRIFNANDMGDHYDVALFRDNKAMLFSSQGAFEEALLEAKASFLLYQAALGPDNVNTILACGAVGTTFLELDRSDSARTYLTRAISANSEEPLTSIHLIEILRSLAELYTRSGQLDSARAFADTALVRTIRGFGPRSRYTAIAQSVLADVCALEGRYSEAFERYGIAMDIMDSVWGPGDMRVARDEADIGRVHYLKGDLVEAEEILLNSYNRRPNPTASWYLYKIASERGDGNTALEWLVRCADLRLKQKGTRPGQRAETIEALQDLATRLGRTDILKEFDME